MNEGPGDKVVDFGFESVAEAEKGARVGGVFSSVANRYDLMNDFMSAGIHRIWKDTLVAMLAPTERMRVVDCAGGTGDIALRILNRSRRRAEAAHVTIVDVNEDMLRAGRARAKSGAAGGALAWIRGDAEALPLPGACCDAYTIAFGIRNVTRRERALREARRILKPGGRFLCLEFSEPVVPVLDTLYERFSFAVIPTLGKLVAGDEAAYRYLVESIRRFPNQGAFAREIAGAGFSHVTFRNLSGGIAAIHSAWAL